MNTLENPENSLAPATALWPRLRRKLLAPETRLLLFWPIFELIFMALERLRPEDTQYFATHCTLDDLIPFWEGAMVPSSSGLSILAGRWPTPTSGMSRPSGG